MTAQQLQVKVKAASDRMRSDDNTKNALKYLEQLTWLLFLKEWDALEDERAMLAAVDGRSSERTIDGEFRWSQWTQAGRTGDELVEWVHTSLLPHLRSLSGTPQGERIAHLFSSVTTVMKSGYGLAEVIEAIDGIDLHAVENAHALSVIYETLLAETSDAGWSGEFYTPRPIVEFMVQLVRPTLDDSIYDPCSGSCGFLVAAAEHLRPDVVTAADEARFTRGTVHGQESGELAYLVGTMNLMLHGVVDPDVVRRNTLEQDVLNIGPSEQHSVVLTNPPFGGAERPQVQQNFPARSAATELLFLQHVMAKLGPTGRCAIVLPDGVLFRGESAFSAVRKRLLHEFALKAIVRLPSGVFATAPGARTNIVFFEREGAPTQSVRYYQVRPPAGKPAFGKADPLTAEALVPALAWIRDGIADGNSWEVDLDDIREAGYDLNITPRLSGDQQVVADPAEQVQFLLAQAADVAESAQRLEHTWCARVGDFEMGSSRRLGNWVQQRGQRAGDQEVTDAIGVSNAGGLVPFRGKIGADTRRYRRVEVGDFVYNPMRVNVGSLALCRHPSEEGWASPEYVVFRLADDAPISAEYLLFFLKSTAGSTEINRHVQGSVRARLYLDNLRQVEVPVPVEPAQWNELLAAVNEVARATRALAHGGHREALAAALFSGWQSPTAAGASSLAADSSPGDYATRPTM
jgi:type I restriction enzyme M protein